MRNFSNLPFVALSNALSWIAFNRAVDGTQLYRGLMSGEFGDRSSADEKLRRAVVQLTSLGADGIMEFRGKHVNGSGVDDRMIDTQRIEPIQFADYSMFDPMDDGLHRGHGLLWSAMEGGGEQMAISRSDDYFRFVVVRRDDLGSLFPMRTFAALPSGDPGRPSKGYQLYVAEFERRKATGKTHLKLRTEAEHLLKWFEEKYPEAERPSVLTIENRIRVRFNERLPQK